MEINLDSIADVYTRFARTQAAGVSPLYERLASHVAQTPELLSFLATLPPARRQPNLFLAAVRLVAGTPSDGAALLEAARAHAPAIRETMLSRTTQTNEPARCALMLPILASLPQPLALLELGASAGLCLLPDRYGYDYGGGRRLSPARDADRAPVLPCRVNDQTPVPKALPEIIWRLGLDLDPRDIGREDDVRWLDTPVWPDQEERRERLHAALEIARSDPPPLREGDLLRDLESAVAEAPKQATLVVFHTAVMAYVAPQAKRDAFARAVRTTGAVWICNEAPALYPQMAATAPAPPHGGLYLQSVDGRPVAWAGAHGQSLDWFGPAP